MKQIIESLSLNDNFVSMLRTKEIISESIGLNDSNSASNKIVLVLGENFNFSEDIISKQTYITDNIREYIVSEQNGRIIEWTKKHIGRRGKIKSGIYKGRDIQVNSYTSMFNSEFQLSGFYVCCLDLNRELAAITCLPEQIDINEKEDY